MKLMILMLMTLVVNSSFAKGFNKCIIEEKVVYTHKNCPNVQNRASFGKGTFSGLNTEAMVNAYNYEALQRRARELSSKGLHKQAAQYQKKADIVAKGREYRETEFGDIEDLGGSIVSTQEKSGPKIIPISEMNTEAQRDISRKPIKTMTKLKSEMELEKKSVEMPINDPQKEQNTDVLSDMPKDNN